MQKKSNILLQNFRPYGEEKKPVWRKKLTDWEACHFVTVVETHYSQYTVDFSAKRWKELYLLYCIEHYEIIEIENEII